MKLFKNILKGLLLALFILLALLSAYIYRSGPSLPDNTDSIIEQVIANPLPEILQGDTGFAVSDGLKIWYEHTTPQDSSKGVVLLIMGISNDALGWPASFLDGLVEAGYEVIRFDHRGTGMSDWVDDWDPADPYSLTDMADDGVAILDVLGIKQAHVIGVSMGGMIAQEIAISHPDRTRSLISMMSSGYIEDPALPQISGDIAWELIRTALKYGIIGGEKNLIKLHLASRMILMGHAEHELNSEGIAQQTLYNIRNRRGYNSGVSRQHQAAVSLSGSRYDKLQNITIPTLIVHGKSDPFIPIDHGSKCASIIPGADSLWIENMGHDLPEDLIDPLIQRISSFLE
ncbi:MAG: alpha/beta fold hydrolase [Rhodothermales bacterium]